MERLKNSYWFLHPNQATQNVHTPGARLKMIEMARAAFGRAQVCEERLKKIDVEEVVYFLKRDFVELGYQAANGKLPRLRFLLGQLIRRSHPTLDHLTERLQGKTWGQSNYTSRYRRLCDLLKKYQVSSPLLH